MFRYVSHPASAELGSVYERTLGDDVERLAPGLRTYFSRIPLGSSGTGEGVYATAGSRIRIARPVPAIMARRDFLFPEHGEAVPFSIRNTSDAEGGLSAVRTFVFPGVVRRMHDRMTVREGRIVDRLGRRGGFEVELLPRVDDGGLRMTSGRLAAWIRGIRVPLPRFALLTLDERADVAEPGVQHVDVRIRMPLLGEVFGYRGSFRYRIESDAP